MTDWAAEGCTRIFLDTSRLVVIALPSADHCFVCSSQWQYSVHLCCFVNLPCSCGHRVRSATVLGTENVRGPASALREATCGTSLAARNANSVAALPSVIPFIAKALNFIFPSWCNHKALRSRCVYSIACNEFAGRTHRVPVIWRRVRFVYSRGKASPGRHSKNTSSI